MQIRLTVTLGPRAGGPPSPASRQPGASTEGVATGASARADVQVTAPTGTPLSAVAGALGSAVAAAASGGAVGSSPSGRGARSGSGAPGAQEAPAVFAGTQRLDPQHPLGTPPLLDGALVALQGPVAEAADAAFGEAAFGTAKARLHVVAGPDAGGVHLLQGGRVSLGRSAEADVPLDDPDVSRTHCAVTVTEGGTVTVTDLDSTNGTTVDGLRVAPGPVLFKPGSVLRIGETTLRLEATGRTPGPPHPQRATTADGEGLLRLTEGERPEIAAAQADGPLPPAAELHPDAGAFAPSAAEPPAPAAPASAVGHTHGSGLAPLAGAELPPHTGESARRRARGPVAWARRFAAPRPTNTPARPLTVPPAAPAAEPTEPEPALPDPAEVLLDALGPGVHLWERSPSDIDARTVRLGTVPESTGAPGSTGPAPARPLSVDLAVHGALGLAGPRPRLLGLARAVLAQLTAARGPSGLQVVLLAADRGRPAEERVADWSWLGWLPHLRPRHGQDCGLLLAFDREQAQARTAELTHRVEAAPHTRGAAESHTLLVVDGDPGTAAVREAVAGLVAAGPRAGVHVLCLAETPAATPASPVGATARAALATSPAFRECRTLALLSGDVATAVRLVRAPAAPEAEPAALGPVATVDGVSAAWAERFARALAPLREPEGPSRTAPTSPLPHTCRLLDELDLSRATPGALRTRWAARAERPPGVPLLFGAGVRGPLEVDLASLGGGTAVVSGPAGSGRSELLRSLAAALAASEPPERLRLLLVDGSAGPAGESAGLLPCTPLPHVQEHLQGGDPVRMRECAQRLGEELKRRAELLAQHGAHTFEEYAAAGPTPSAPPNEPAGRGGSATAAPHPGSTAEPAAGTQTTHLQPPLPRVVVLVDDFDTLADPALGNPGRPAAGSVVRALEAVARDGARLGVHLVLTTGRSARAAEATAVQAAELRAELSGDGSQGAPRGRGTLQRRQEAPTAFQSGGITGRIPRTATLRPTVVPLEWARAGDPPARRQVRELGNGPTDLALLTSALERAAGSGTSSAGASPAGGETATMPAQRPAPEVAASTPGEPRRAATAAPRDPRTAEPTSRPSGGSSRADDPHSGAGDVSSPETASNSRAYNASREPSTAATHRVRADEPPPTRGPRKPEQAAHDAESGRAERSAPGREASADPHAAPQRARARQESAPAAPPVPPGTRDT